MIMITYTIYILGYTTTLIGLFILITEWNKFVQKLNKLQKFAFILISLGILIPLAYGLILGIIENVKL